MFCCFVNFNLYPPLMLSKEKRLQSIELISEILFQILEDFHFPEAVGKEIKTDNLV